MGIRIKTIDLNITIIWNSEKKKILFWYIMIILESVRNTIKIFITFHIKIYYIDLLIK